jgi:predicted dehydrogenase
MDGNGKTVDTVGTLDVIADRGWSTAARVAIAGVGGVARYAHLAAYRQLGVRVVALHDTSAEALEQVRREVPDAVAIRDPGEFADRLAASNVQLLDVAVPSPAHADFLDLLFDRIGTLCPALLVQKPLAPDSATAARLVGRARDLGIRLGINLNARWVPPLRAARDFVRAGEIGPVQAGTLLNRGWNPKRGDEWRAMIPRLIGYEMAIHHVDLLIWMLGPPTWVFAAIRQVDGLGVRGDTFASMTLGFGATVITVIEDWTCRDERAWRFHPTDEELTLSGPMGTLVATPTRLRITTESDSRQWHTTASWFPDAFAGPPAEVLSAVAENRPMTIDGQDHLTVLRVLDAMYLSSECGRVVNLPAEDLR